MTSAAWLSQRPVSTASGVRPSPSVSSLTQAASLLGVLTNCSAWISAARFDPANDPEALAAVEPPAAAGWGVAADRRAVA